LSQGRVDFAELIAEAATYARPIRTSEDCKAGGVAALVVSASGRKYTGICVDFACSLGFCAEHAAVAEMLKAHESQIAYVVAVLWSGKVIPPCGRCREMMWQLDPRNRDAAVILAKDRAVALHELLPYPSTPET
jgi:cytidine deaminase